jgi:peptidoglycan/LPS O-acetylase OafA/YrhL
MEPNTPTHDVPGRQRIDSLRGIAALSVFGFHAWLYTLPIVRATPPTRAFEIAMYELRLGLALFFVLSGYLLFKPWVRAAAAGTATPSLTRYALRRAARILPAYYVALVGSFLLLWQLRGMPGVRLPDLERVWLFLVFGQNMSTHTVMSVDPPMWTLAIEASFYAILPLLGWLALRGRRSAASLLLVAGGFALVGVVWNIVTAKLGLGIVWSKSLPAVAPLFAAGMAVAVLADRRSIGRRAATALAGGGLLLIGIRVWSEINQASGGHAAVPLGGSGLLTALGFAAVIAASVMAEPRAQTRTWNPVASFGTVSYGFYLWHVPVLIAMRAYELLPLNGLAAAAVAFPVATACASVSWRWVERPIMRWAKSVESRTSLAPLAA